MFRTI